MSAQAKHFIDGTAQRVAPDFSDSMPDDKDISLTLSYKPRSLLYRSAVLLFCAIFVLLPAALFLKALVLHGPHALSPNTGQAVATVTFIFIFLFYGLGIFLRPRSFADDPRLMSITATGLWLHREKLFVPYERLLQIRDIYKRNSTYGGPHILAFVLNTADARKDLTKRIPRPHHIPRTRKTKSEKEFGTLGEYELDQKLQPFCDYILKQQFDHSQATGWPMPPEPLDESRNPYRND